MNALLTHRGYASIGLVRPKCASNVGGVLRAAHAYGAQMIAIQGERTPLASREDTSKAWRHIPVLRADDLFTLIPYDAVPIAVDLLDDATSLPAYEHPERAFYIFGPEDSTLGKAVTARCRDKIVVPTRFCMNLAATVNVVLYDRLAKAEQSLAAGLSGKPRVRQLERVA